MNAYPIGRQLKKAAELKSWRKDTATESAAVQFSQDGLGDIQNDVAENQNIS